MTIDLDELERLAKAASLAESRVAAGIVVIDSAIVLDCAKFYELSGPDVLLSLIARLRAAEQRGEMARAVVRRLTPWFDGKYDPELDADIDAVLREDGDG